MLEILNLFANVFSLYFNGFHYNLTVDFIRKCSSQCIMCEFTQLKPDGDLSTYKSYYNYRPKVKIVDFLIFFKFLKSLKSQEKHRY